MNDKLLNRIGSFCSIIPFAWTGISFVRNIVNSAQNALVADAANIVILAGLFKLYTIMFLGLLVAIAHGILWSVIERIFQWSFGAGGGDSLPRGWQAILLSCTMTLPLVLFPVAYERLTDTKLVPHGHWPAAVAVVVLASIAHLVLYGTASPAFRGLKNIVFPLNSDGRLSRAILMELIYTVVHFGSIVLPYRWIIGVFKGAPHLSDLTLTLLSGSLFFSGACLFIFVRWPDSLRDQRWIQVRGVVNAAVLTVALQGGILI